MGTVVSIPQWCDCYYISWLWLHPCKLVSIPQWCDCYDGWASAPASRSAGFNPTMVRLLLSNLHSTRIEFPVSIPQWCDCYSSSKLKPVKMFMVSIPQWCDCYAPNPLKVAVTENGFNPTMVRLLPLKGKGKTKYNRVSIPQWCDCYKPFSGKTPITFCSFNPTMVRLLRGEEIEAGSAGCWFQSHNGAIATWWALQEFRQILVSIPQWCDCYLQQ